MLAYHCYALGQFFSLTWQQMLVKFVADSPHSEAPRGCATGRPH